MGTKPSREGVRGKPRRALAVAGLHVATLGVYGAFLRHRLPKELDIQHGRPPGTLLWGLSLIPLLGLPFYVLHTLGATSRLKDYRRARGLRAGMGPFWTLVLSLPGMVAFYGVLIWNYLDAAFFEELGSYKTHYLATDAWFEPTTLPPVEVLGGAAVLWLILRTVCVAIQAKQAQTLWMRIYDEHGEVWPYAQAVA